VSGWQATGSAEDWFFRVRSAFPLIIEFEGAGSGTVTSQELNLDCSSGCQVLIDEGSTVTLYANPSADSQFAGWTGDFTGTSDCNLVMDSPKTVAATFTQTSTGGNFVNGDFEQGPTVGWLQEPGPMIYTAAELGVPVFSGQYAAWVGYASDNRASAAIGQTVNLPMTWPLYLNFALWLYSEELCDVPYFDVFGVYVNGVAIEENPRLCAGNTGGDGWRTVSLDLSGYAGQDALIVFEISSTGTLASVALIDDVFVSSTPW
jgi:hypothetical protein